jgi:hypothetical protein
LADLLAIFHFCTIPLKYRETETIFVTFRKNRKRGFTSLLIMRGHRPNGRQFRYEAIAILFGEDKRPKFVVTDHPRFIFTRVGLRDTARPTHPPRDTRPRILEYEPPTPEMQPPPPPPTDIQPLPPQENPPPEVPDTGNNAPEGADAFPIFELNEQGFEFSDGTDPCDWQ